MSSIEARLRELGVTLPPAAPAGGNYIPARTIGNVVLLSGVISMDPEGNIITGTMGLDSTIEQGYAAARRCAIGQLGVLQRHLGSLDKVRSVLSLNGYVNAVNGFTDAAKVVNGASDLLVEVFGEAGRHVRAAIGVNALPRKALVEVQMSVEI
ncbi:MAG TPA: RidA family protein [Dongiaceae bacterium]|nr:RidA family protein [Dongiaceae bacterium]